MTERLERDPAALTRPRPEQASAELFDHRFGAWSLAHRLSADDREVGGRYLSMCDAYGRELGRRG